MTRWSGLAPAVNAHLARWRRVHEEGERLTRKSMARQLNKLTGEWIEAVPVRSDTFPISAAWSQFARSWGLPQADGTVHTPLREVVEGTTINGREQFVDTQASAENGSQLLEIEHRMLDAATTTYVSGDIVERITREAPTMEPEPIFETDLFSPSGLLVLETPLYVPDYHPDTGEMTDYLHIAIRAIGWHPNTVYREDENGVMQAGPGTMLITYTTYDDYRSSYAPELLRAYKAGKIGRPAIMNSVDGFRDLNPEDQQRAMDELLAGTVEIIPPRFSEGTAHDLFLPCDVMPWRFKTAWTSRPRPLYEPGTIDASVAYVRRWFLTLMRFTWQNIVIAERPPKLPPKVARRITEARRPNHDYTVLRLRRREGRSPVETGMGQPLGYRLRVIGHWRRVWVPSLGPARNPDGSFNHDSHRLKKIEPYWRGPEDAPLGPMDHAATITR